MLTTMVEGMGEALGEMMSTAMETAFTGVPDEDFEAKRLQYWAIRGLTIEEYESTWKNSVDYHGKTAKVALTELAQALSLSIHAPAVESQLNEKVTVETKALSRLEAIHKISEQVGVYPTYPDMSDYLNGFGGATMGALTDGLTTMLEGTAEALEINVPDDRKVQEPPSEPAPNAIQFHTEKPEYPIAFSGPFLFEITDLEDNAPRPMGIVSMSLKAYGLDNAVLSLLQDVSTSLVFDGLVDPNGKSLIEEYVMYMNSGEISNNAYVDHYGLELKSLLSSVTHIQRFSGTQKLPVRREVKEITFENIERGQKTGLGDLAIEIKSG